MTILRAFKWAAALLLALQAFELGVASHLRAPYLWGFTTASYCFGSLLLLFQTMVHFQTGEPNSFFPFRIIGLVAGIGFVLVAALFARRLFDRKSMRRAAVALLIASGGFLFFFGYIETYALGFMAVLLYL